MIARNSIQNTTEQSAQWYAAHFESFEKRLNGDTATKLHAIRRAGMDRFRATGFPSVKDEEWRFTNVSPFTSIPYSPARGDGADTLGAAEMERYILRGLPGYRVVFVNGFFAPRLSNLPGEEAGVRVENLAAHTGRAGSSGLPRFHDLARTDDLNPFTALNTAFLHDGLVLTVPPGVSVGEPLSVIFWSSHEPDPHFANPRNLVVVGENARVSIVEEHFGSVGHSYFNNIVGEVFAGAGATVEYDRFQHEDEKAFHVSSLFVHQEGRSNVTVNTVSYGGAMVRHNVNAVLDGEDAECTLNGLTLTTGTQHIDNHTSIDHAKPSCRSHELYKAILEGSSRGVFNGKIFVRKDAQKTDAKQTNKTLLLSDRATMDTKPQLEIFADDVKCTHGATVGQLDEDQIFYLRSRGIGFEDSRDILTNAFASDVLNRIRIEPLREHLQAILHVRLCKGRILSESP